MKTQVESHLQPGQLPAPVRNTISTDKVRRLPSREFQRIAIRQETSAR